MSGFSQFFVGIIRTDPRLFIMTMGTSSILFGYCLTDPMLLRSLSIFASTCNMYYHFSKNPPMYTHMMWGCLFISVNIYHISIMSRERRDIKLTLNEKQLYFKNFKSLRKNQFRDLMNLSHFQRINNQILINQGQESNEFWLLTSGTLEIIKDGKVIYEIKANTPMAFVGELKLLNRTDGKSIATVRAVNSCTLLKWDMKDLEHLSKEFKINLQNVFKDSIVFKIKSQNQYKALQKLKILLQVIMHDNKILKEDKILLQKFIKQKNINEKQLKLTLQEIGWTWKEFLEGQKQKQIFLK